MKKLNSLLLLAILLISSCGSDDGGTDPVVETSGPISGSVNLFDSRGLAVQYDQMTVSIVGTELTAQTNGQGAFNFPSVPFGDYVLAFTKDNFGTHMREVEHDKGFSQNGTNLITISLGQISQTDIYETIPQKDGGNINLRVVTTPVGTATSPVYVSVFFSSEISVSNSENQGVIGPVRFFSGNSANTITITASQLSEMGFNSGDNVYFKVYGDSFHTNEYESDNGTVHPNVKTPGSGIMSVVLP